LWKTEPSVAALDHAELGLWALRVFVVAMSVLVIYTFVAGLG
jgi:hypothetical protein